MLQHIASLVDSTRASPTAMLWMHNEGDASWDGQTTAAWEGAVRYDASLVRAALGQGAASVPYLFTDVIPFDPDNAASMNAIRKGMENMSADPAFNAAIATHTGDLDMDNPANGLPNGRVIYGGPHVDAVDVKVLAGRISRKLINTFSSYALPGSPLDKAGGRLDDTGPQATEARRVLGMPDELMVGLKFDAASPSLVALSPGAAAGLGWTVEAGGVTLHATSARAESSGLIIGFGQPLPEGSMVLRYASGTGRVAMDADVHTGANWPGPGPGSPGRGNSIYDDQGEPVWAMSGGVLVPDLVALSTPSPTFRGGTGEYRIADTGGGHAIVSDSVVGRDGTVDVMNGTVLAFTDGHVLFDPSGLGTSIARLYMTGLGRAPDPYSLQQAVAAHTDVQTFADFIPVSPEFMARYGTADTASFVDTAFTNGLGRHASLTELSATMDAMAHGQGRGQVLLGIASSTESRLYLDSRFGDGTVADVVRLYHSELGRAPEAGATAAWMEFISSHGISTTEAARQFGLSPEFMVKHGSQSNTQFVEGAYRDALGRDALIDDQGWIDALSQGAYRADTALAIGNSVEGRIHLFPTTHEGLVSMDR